jgi:hypothetical protein
MLNQAIPVQVQATSLHPPPIMPIPLTLLAPATGNIAHRHRQGRMPNAKFFGHPHSQRHGLSSAQPVQERSLLRVPV